MKKPLFVFEGSTEEALARAAAEQRQLIYNFADGIERGELAADDELRKWIALILRASADALLKQQPRKRRGNPGKLPDDMSPLIMVRIHEMGGMPYPEAVGAVALSFGVNESRIREVYRRYRVDADRFLGSKVHFLGRGRRNSEK